jgi:hypothetical protein
MQVQCRVPRGRDEEVVRGRVEDVADTLVMRRHDRLRARLEVYPPYLPVQSTGKGLAVVASKADV